MVRITKVYTKTGDKGMTSLAASKRIAKTSQRIIAIGDLDELNSFLGFAITSVSNNQEQTIKNKILRIQNEIFNLGAQLAVLPTKRRKNTPTIHIEDVVRLENEIDEMNKKLPTLKSFILPGGSELSARLHIARSICRRAERSLVLLTKKTTLNGTELPYLNRLSDWLFVAARFANASLNIKEFLWQP